VRAAPLRRPSAEGGSQGGGPDLGGGGAPLRGWSPPSATSSRYFLVVKAWAAPGLAGWTSISCKV
jgi:hypothetical protein